MTIDKIIKEIDNRIEYLEKKKSELHTKEVTLQEQHKIRDKYNLELDKLRSMKNCCQ